MRIAYLDCGNGLSGDMLLAAGIAAGGSLERVRAGLGRLGLRAELAVEAAECGGSPALRLKMPPAGAVRPWSEAARLLDRAGLAPAVAARARAVFLALAQAEARAGPLGAEADEIALLEVVGSALVLEDLGVERLQCSPVNVGGNGAPPSAVLELLRGVPIYSSGAAGPLVTPVGAALARGWAQGFGPMPPLRSEAAGQGAAGEGAGGGPLRLIVGRAVESPATGATSLADAGDESRVVVLEANLDDCNPQFQGHLAERAWALGALDVYSVPAQMKKNRPGWVVTILARPEQAAQFERLLLEETTTLGVRSHFARRAVLDRRILSVATAYGPIRIKVAAAGARTLNAAPEYEDCREAALRHQVPLKQVYQEALRVYANEAANSTSSAMG